MAQWLKNLPANAGDSRDVSSIPGSGRSPGEVATHSTILTWEIPWIEKHGRLQPWGHKELDTTENIQQVFIEKDTSYHVLCRIYLKMPKDALLENVF